MRRAGLSLVALIGLLSPAQLFAQRLPGLTRVAPTPVSATNFTATATAGGVQLSWTGVPEAALYHVSKGVDASRMCPIGQLHGSATSFLDPSFPKTIYYQVTAFTQNRQYLAPVTATYTPPAPATVATLDTRSTLTTLSLSTRTLTTTSTSLPPITVTSMGESGTTLRSARVGEVVTVQGQGFDGTMTAALIEGAPWPSTAQIPCGNLFVFAYPLANQPLIPQAPSNITSTSFTFAAQVSRVPSNVQEYTPYFLVTSRAGVVDTTRNPILMMRALPERKVTGAVAKVIRSGAFLDLIGVGLQDLREAYFGVGLPGTVSNPPFSIGSPSPTLARFVTTPTCNQEGWLSVKQQGLMGESPDVAVTPALLIACVPATPSGMIVGSNSAPNGVVNVAPGARINITGTHLKYVTRVVDNQNVGYPFTYAKVGTADVLTVTLPSTAGRAFGFSLENSLTNPVVNGTVAGTVFTIAPPTWYRVDLAWAEPGQLVTVRGHQLKYNTMPTVKVGNFPATVTAATDLYVTFRMAAGTTTGPIEIQNEAGSVQVVGPYTTGFGTQSPGFYVVSGPSVITQIVAPRPTLAYGDILTVYGQNLARLNGICVQGTGLGRPAGYFPFRKVINGQVNNGSLGTEASNTQMQVMVEDQPAAFTSAPVQLYAPATPVGDLPPSAFACAANPQVVSWP